jgi:uncharacterized membrane protein
MQIEPWHTPVLVMASVVILYVTVLLIARTRQRRSGFIDGKRLSTVEKRPSITERWVWTVTLAVVAILMLVILFQAFGPSPADRLATIASLLMEFVALWLTLQSYLELKASKAAKDNNGSPANKQTTAPREP